MPDEPKRSTFWQDLLHIAVATAVGNVVILGNMLLFTIVVNFLDSRFVARLPWLTDLAARRIIMLGMLGQMLGFVCMAFCDVAAPFCVVWRMSKARRDSICRQLNPLFWGAFSMAMLSILAAACLQYEKKLRGHSWPWWLLVGCHFLLLAPTTGWLIAVARLKWREKTMDRREAWRAALYGGLLLYVASWWAFVGITFLEKHYIDWFPRRLHAEIYLLISACVLFPFALAVGAKMLLKAMEE